MITQLRDEMLSLKNNKKRFIAFSASALLAFNAWAYDFNFMDTLKSPDFYFTPEAVEILKAASVGDSTKIKRNVIEGTRIESKGPHNPGKSLHQITLLSYAVGINDATAIATLIQSGANPTFTPTPRQDNTFTFAIMKQNIAGLEELFKNWPVAKLSEKEKSKHLFSATSYGCQPCLNLFVDKGYNINILNAEKENLFISALHNAEWDIALWLLKEKNISMKVESVQGITPPNAVQFYEYQQKPKSLSRDKLKEMEQYMTTHHNIKFPVLTRLQIQEQNEIKKMNTAPHPIKSK